MVVLLEMARTIFTFYPIPSGQMTSPGADLRSVFLVNRLPNPSVELPTPQSKCAHLFLFLSLKPNP